MRTHSRVSLSIRSLLTAFGLFSIGVLAAQGQATAPAVSLGSVAVGTPATGTATFTFSGTTAVASVGVVTQGVAGLDFQQTAATSSDCVNAAPAVGGTCSVSVTYKPLAPGFALGAAVLFDASGTRLGIASLSGQATGGIFIQAPTATATAVPTAAISQSVNMVDAAGNIYTADRIYNRVSRYGVDGTVTTCTCGTNSPWGIAVDGAGYVYVGNYNGNTVTKIDLAKQTFTTVASITKATGVAFDAAGNLYVANYTAGGAVFMVTPAGVVSAIATGMTYPLFLAVDAPGNVYVTSTQTNNLFKIAPGSSTPTQLPGVSSSSGVAVDPAGNVYTLSGPTVYVYSTVSNTATSFPSTITASNAGIAGLDRQGNLYLADTYNAATQVYKLSRSANGSYAPTGTTPRNSVSAEKTFTLSNIGNAPATVTGLVTTANVQVGSSETCSTASTAVNGSCVESVAFAPVALGSPQTGTLTVNGNFVSPVLSVTGYVANDPSKLSITTQPSANTVAGGSAGTLVATIQDNTSTKVSTSSLPVTLTVSGPQGYSQSYMKNASFGTASFDLSAATLTAAGTYTYTVSSSSLASASTLGGVSAGATRSLALNVGAGTATGGTPATFTVTAFDAYANAVTNYSGPVTLTSSDPLATFASTSLTLTAGTATSTVTFATGGMQTITVKDSTVSALTATGSYTVTAVPTYVVTAITDVNGGVAANCTSSTGAPCELRDALAAADAAAFTGTASTQPIILFSSSLYGQTVTLASTVTVSHNFALLGPGPASTVKVAGRFVLSGANAFTLSGTTFTGANLSSGASAITAVTANHSVTLTNDVFDSFASNTNGGAINVGNGTLNVTGSTFTKNSTPASISGGAIYASTETATISNSIFGGMGAVGNSAGANGGAIFYNAASRPLTITKSLFAGNTAGSSTVLTPGLGGAIYIGSTPTVKIIGSTFTNNSALSTSSTGGNGGALYLAAVGNLVYLYSTTISGNSAHYQGGGVYKTGSLYAYDSIVYGNTAVAYPDVYTSVTANVGSLVNVASSAVTLNANLSPLGNWGGTMPTMVPLPGSTALARGSRASTCLPAGSSCYGGDSTDARGFARLPGGTTLTDAGAVQTSYSLSYVQQPTSTTTGAAIAPSPTVQVYESGVPLAVSGMSVTEAASAGTASGTLTQTTDATGLATFPGLSFAAPQSGEVLTASVVTNYTATTFVKSASNGFDVTNNGAATIGFVSAPNLSVKNGGNAGVVKVGLYAAGSVLDATSASSVTLTVSGAATATYTASAVNGVAVFDLSAVALTANGSVVYTASSGYTADTITAPETVSADVVTSFSVTGLQALLSPGVAYTFTVTAVGSNGGALTTYTGPVTITSSDTAAVISPANYTFSAADAGVKTFKITANTFGSLVVTATGGGATGSASVTVAGNFVWVVNADGTVTKLSPNGSPAVAGVGTTSPAATLGGVAFDNAGSVWTVTSTANALDYLTKSGTGSATFTGGGLNAPAGVAVDGSGLVWVANSGGNSVSAFTNAGVAKSGTAGYGSAALSGPSSVTLDNTGGVWVTNKTSGTVTHIYGAATPVVTPASSATANGTVGVTP